MLAIVAMVPCTLSTAWQASKTRSQRAALFTDVSVRWAGVENLLSGVTMSAIGAMALAGGRPFG